MTLMRSMVFVSEYVCATCSGAMSQMDRQVVKFMVGMGFITVMTFTWFVGGTGIVW